MSTSRPGESTRFEPEAAPAPSGPIRLDPELITQINALAEHLSAARTLVVFPAAGGSYHHVLSLSSVRGSGEGPSGDTNLREFSRTLQDTLGDADQIVRSHRGLGSRPLPEVDTPLPEGVEEYLFFPLRGENGALRAGLYFYFVDELRIDEKRRRTLRILHDQLALILRQSDYVDALLSKNAELQKRASRDSLTGLPDQESIVRTLKREHSRMTRYRTRLSVLMADLDYFKEVNDQYGHQHGDRVLKRVSTTFEESIRSSDSVGRYGGEEFLFVMPEISEGHALGAAERLRRTLARTRVLEEADPSLRITVSIGATDVTPAENLSVHSLVNQADQALYEAKNRGRNQSVGFSSLPDPAQETAV